MKKLLSLLGLGIFTMFGIVHAQESISFESAYAQMLHYAKSLDLQMDEYEHTQSMDTFSVKGEIEDVAMIFSVENKGTRSKSSPDMKNAMTLKAEFSEGIDFFGEIEMGLETILKDGDVYYKVSGASGTLSEWGETIQMDEYFESEFLNTWIKDDSGYLDIGMSYVDTEYLNSMNIPNICLPEYPLFKMVKQQGNVFTLAWDKLNIAKFMREISPTISDPLWDEIIGDLIDELSYMEEIIMTVNENSISLQFGADEDDQIRFVFSNKSLLMSYKSMYGDELYLIVKQGEKGTKIGGIVVEDGEAQYLGIFDLHIQKSSSTNQTLTLKGNLKALEAAWEDLDITIDYTTNQQSINQPTIDAPAKFIDWEEYYRGGYDDVEEIDFETYEEYYDYYYAEEQAQYGKFCTNEQEGCKVVNKSEVLAILACKQYVDDYSAQIAMMEDKADQEYYAADILNDLNELQTLNVNFASYYCDQLNEWLGEKSVG